MDGGLKRKEEERKGGICCQEKFTRLRRMKWILRRRTGKR